MPIKYTENHHLYSDADGTSVHVALHLQGADLPAAQLFVSRVLDVAGGFVRALISDLPDGVLWPQTSGPCVHYDPEGETAPDGDGEAGVCAYPSERGLCPHLDSPEIFCPLKGACYAMREIASLRESCEAEQEEQDQDMAADLAPRSDYVLTPRDPQEQAADAGESEPEFLTPEPEETPVYKTKACRVPEQQVWTAEENAVLASATSRQEAITLFRERFPGTARTDGAIRRQWYDVRPPLATAPPDGRRGTWTAEEDAVLLQETAVTAAVQAYQARFCDGSRTPAALSSRYYRIRRKALKEGRLPAPASDRAPVTQTVEPAGDIDPDECDPDQMVGPEPATGKGFYGDARALHADQMDGTTCDRPLSQEPRGGETASHPWFGMRVRVLDPPDLAERTGTVMQYGLGPEELLVALDESPDRVWLPPESLLLIGAGRGSS